MPGLADTCGKCGQTYPYSLPRCGFCRRPVCGSCAARIGGAIFCGRTCSHSFFYGADEDIDDDSSEADEAQDDE